MNNNIIPPHGQYQQLDAYKNSVVIFDATYDFCNLFLTKGDRTIDQMTQAARSGKQNIVEGCEASAISTEIELRLIGVARGSLEELLEDYRDYLRTHRLTMWNKDDARILAIRQLARQDNRCYGTYKSYFQLGKNTPELFCNVLISLIHQTNYLLDHLLKKLAHDFKEKGGLHERMYNARTGYRTAKTDEALTLLQEIYSEIAPTGRTNLLIKITRVTEILQHL